MTTLLLVRHAHTDSNDLGRAPRLSGWTDVPLSDLGRQQLTRLRVINPGATSRAVYSSDSQRALQTATTIAGGAPIIALRSLREIDCGRVDGWPLSGVKEEFPDLWRRNEAQDDETFCWPGGESYVRFRHRIIRAADGIACRHPGERVVVVTHSGVISQLAGFVEGESAACWSRWRPENCTLTEIEWSNGHGRIIEFGRPLVDDRASE